MIQNNDYLTNLSNNLARSISKQQDNLIFQVLKDNNIDYFNLTELSKKGRFLKYEDVAGKIKYTTFNYDGRDLLMIFEPEIKFNDYKISCEVKFKKLY